MFTNRPDSLGADSSGLAVSVSHSPHASRRHTESKSTPEPSDRRDVEAFLANALIELRQAARIANDSGIAWSNPFPERHVFIYLHKFAGKLIVDGAEKSVVRKSAYLCPPAASLKLIGDADQELEVFVLAFDLFRAVEKTEARRTYERESDFPVKGWIRGPFYDIQRIASQLAENAELGEFKRQRLITDLLCMLWPQEESDAPAHDQELPDAWLHATMRYMRNHYMHEIKLEKLADIAGMHPSYYSQLFKSRMHKNPIEYLTHLRMNRAKELMLTSDLRIRDVARSVGYRDEFYFSRRFRSHSGFAPTIYVKQVHRNVVSLSYPYTDHLMTLGITPCAAQIQGQLPHLPKSLTLPFHAHEPWEQGRQAFLDVKPDLVLTKDNVAAKALEHIGDIAPIITIPWNKTDMFGHLQTIAGIMDREHAAKEWLERHDRKAERARKRIGETWGQATVAVCTLTAKGPRMYSNRNFGHVFYRSLHLTPPDRIRAELAGKTTGVGFNWLPFTPGEWDGLEADILVVAITSMQGRAALLQQLAADPLWKRHPAVRHGRVHVIDWNSWVVYAPYSINLQLDEAVHLLTGKAPIM